MAFKEINNKKCVCILFSALVCTGYLQPRFIHNLLYVTQVNAISTLITSDFIPL